MNKSDLKAGYVVILKNGTRGIVMPFYNETTCREDLVIAFNSKEWCSLEKYDEGLQHYLSIYNICRVYGLSSNPETTMNFDDFAERPLIWER